MYSYVNSTLGYTENAFHPKLPCVNEILRIHVKPIEFTQRT